MSSLFNHEDHFRHLDSRAPLSDKLKLLHDMLRMHYAFIDRIAVALYDDKTDMLRTFVWSSDTPSPLTQYQATLADSPSLCEIIEKATPRVVNDMDIYRHGQSLHSQVLAQAGFGASYTLPMFHGEALLGFIFFNSLQKNVFQEAMLNDLDMVGHMISLMVAAEKNVLETLQATVRSAMGFTHHRDPETATHIDRMSRYARLIARELAGEYGFDDQFVEHVFLFSPLHDLGKIGIPDKILLKPGKLSEAEFGVMKTHAVKGREMIDALLKNYGLDGVAYINMLRNIAEHHHEAYDGSGYPAGLKAEAIPIEARIVTVADVFDALTSRRSYKEAWDNDAAFNALRNMAGRTLDVRCVDVLLAHRVEVEQIQRQFRENSLG
jgi:HD-GYP domain-containing protein (c-di-GMP phosphodiesterase class II)